MFFRDRATNPFVGIALANAIENKILLFFVSAYYYKLDRAWK